MKSNYILSEAANLISGDRRDNYGDANDRFQCIADIWSAMKGVNFTAGEVGRFMIAVKLARLSKNPAHEDGYIDIAGYAALIGEIETDDA